MFEEAVYQLKSLTTEKLSLHSKLLGVVDVEELGSPSSFDHFVYCSSNKVHVKSHCTLEEPILSIQPNHVMLN